MKLETLVTALLLFSTPALAETTIEVPADRGVLCQVSIGPEKGLKNQQVLLNFHSKAIAGEINVSQSYSIETNDGLQAEHTLSLRAKIIQEMIVDENGKLVTGFDTKIIGVLSFFNPITNQQEDIDNSGFTKGQLKFRGSGYWFENRFADDETDTLNIKRFSVLCQIH